jgi:GTP cyclohydrolase IA
MKKSKVSSTNLFVPKMTWSDIHVLVGELLEEIRQEDYGRLPRIYGIPTGGSIIASLLCTLGVLPQVDDPEGADVIIDDICDSGETLAPYLRMKDTDVWVLVNKSSLMPIKCIRRAKPTDFIEFPWAHKEEVGEKIVTRMLQYIGEDCGRPGLKETPDRVVRAWKELFVGYNQDPKNLCKTFDYDADEIVVVKNITFASMCEHHMLPFLGTATVGYLPHKKVIGLSKIPRLVEIYARRLQIQEKMTNQIALALMDIVEPLGVGVRIKANHLCAQIRGVGKNVEMVTAAMYGLFRKDEKIKNEFLSIANA